MPMYQGTEFDKSLIPNSLKKDSREIIEVAASLGWKVHITTAEGVTIIAPPPNERKRYHFGKAGRASISHNRIKRDVFKYADPKLLAAADAVLNANTEEEAIMAAQVTPLLGEKGTIVDARPETESSEPLNPEPRLISSKPMIASRGNRSGYDSETTLERRWSDGTTDYSCTLCDFYSTDRLAPSRHFGTAHRKGQGKSDTPPAYKVDVPDKAGYAPRKTRIEALARLLEQMAENDDSWTYEDIAETALTWVHEQSKQGSDLAGEHEPMSAEETLARIRSLVDDGGYFQMRKQVEALETQVVEALAEADRQRVAAEQSRNTLQALRDLVAEVGSEEAEG